MEASGTNRTIRIFRYDPTVKDDGHFDKFVVRIPDESRTTILDLLLCVQREHDPSLAFRYACRVNMCGSCAIVINGREGLACKTSVSQIPRGKEITLRPLNHFPVIKDLVVDMEPFFQSFADALAFYYPGEDTSEPASIPPGSPERKEIGSAIDCIACGCCVSSCTMCRDDDYAGPAALNRAFTLLYDSRDGRFEERFERVLASCYHCRTEFNCTEVCPKGISATKAIKSIQRLALRHARDIGRDDRHAGLLSDLSEPTDPVRRTFLQQSAVGAIGIGAAIVLGSAAVSAGLGPKSIKTLKQWVPIARLESLPIGEVTTLTMSYDVQNGLYTQRVTTPVMISRTTDGIVCFKADCPHLGCGVRWNAGAGCFRCSCHGGSFDRDGKVLSGPPPRPLDRYACKIESGQLLVEVG